MTRAAAPGKRPQSAGEEIANGVSHGVGLLAAVVAGPILILDAVQRGGAADVVGVSIFATTVALLYLTSVLFHSLPANRGKRVFQVLDHGAIFLLIAGTYTPFTLGILRGAWGWSLFGIVWGLAAVGLGLKATSGVRHAKVSLCLYLAMGWVVIIAIRPLWVVMPAEGLYWLLAGGIAYTVGVAFYTADHLRYAHFVWHLFVLAGTACHFVAVMGFSAGA